MSREQDIGPHCVSLFEAMRVKNPDILAINASILFIKEEIESRNIELILTALSQVHAGYFPFQRMLAVIGETFVLLLEKKSKNVENIDAMSLVQALQCVVNGVLESEQTLKEQLLPSLLSLLLQKGEASYAPLFLIAGTICVTARHAKHHEVTRAMIALITELIAQYREIPADAEKWVVELSQQFFIRDKSDITQKSALDFLRQAITETKDAALIFDFSALTISLHTLPFSNFSALPFITSSVVNLKSHAEENVEFARQYSTVLYNIINHILMIEDEGTRKLLLSHLFEELFSRSKQFIAIVLLTTRMVQSNFPVANSLISLLNALISVSFLAKEYQRALETTFTCPLQEFSNKSCFDKLFEVVEKVHFDTDISIALMTLFLSLNALSFENSTNCVLAKASRNILCTWFLGKADTIPDLKKRHAFLKEQADPKKLLGMIFDQPGGMTSSGETNERKRIHQEITKIEKAQEIEVSLALIRLGVTSRQVGSINADEPPSGAVFVPIM